MEISKDLPLYLSLIEKPINLLFSIDQFVFEFSKKTYQQKKSGEFFQQLKERKKVSLFYGDLPRKQLVKFFQDARKMKGYFSKNLLALVESRLDVVLYRNGLVRTIAEGRQLIKHKKVQVNQKFISSPSIVLKPGDIISLQKLGNQLTHFLKTTKDKKQKAQTEDISLQFQKNLNLVLNQRLVKKENSKKKATKNNSVLNIPSKIFCNLLTQLICTQIKLRSFWNTKQLKFNSLNLQSSNLHKSKVPEKNWLTTFKWKSFSRRNVIRKNLLKNKNQQHFANEGSLKKKPVFWVKNLGQLALKFQVNFNETKKKNKQFSVEKTTSLQNQQDRLQRTNFGQKIYLPEEYSKQLINFKSENLELERKKKHQKPLIKKSILLYRKSFLLFLKQINSHSKFSNLVGLKIKNFLLKKSFFDFQTFSMSKKVFPFGKKLERSRKSQSSSFLKELNFRTLRPLNSEVSYNILTVIYLYSPQRVNFPFYIDFDLIKRSLG